MIIGAGEAGNTIIKEIVSSNFSTMVIRCIIDDDKNKWGRFIQGIKVVGGRDKIIESADLYDIDEIFLAIPSASAGAGLRISWKSVKRQTASCAAFPDCISS